MLFGTKKAKVNKEEKPEEKTENNKEESAPEATVDNPTSRLFAATKLVLAVGTVITALASGITGLYISLNSSDKTDDNTIKANVSYQALADNQNKMTDKMEQVMQDVAYMKGQLHAIELRLQDPKGAGNTYIKVMGAAPKPPLNAANFVALDGGSTGLAKINLPDLPANLEMLMQQHAQ